MHALDIITRRRAVGLLAAATIPAIASRARAADTKRILFFTKSSGFEHDVINRNGNDLSLAERGLAELGMKHGFEVAATKDGRVFDGDLSAYSAVCFFTTGDLMEPGTDRAPPMSPRGKAALLAAIREGKGFLGLHCASDTFHSKGDEPDPYIAMLGGEFMSHGRQQEASVRVVDAAFPGLESSSQGFKIFEEWYSLKNFAKDLHVLMAIETQGMQDSEYARPPYPLAWTRAEGKGRVYYNAMGHREDVWTSTRFQDMLAGALEWSTGRTQIGAAANILEVTPQASVMPPRNPE
jgi:type 1 glutamine amidotransferase